MNNNRWETKKRGNHEINLRARQAQRLQQQDEQEAALYTPNGMIFPVSGAKLIAFSSALISLVALMVGVAAR